MDKMLQKQEELGYYKGKCCKSATRARRAAGGSFCKLRGIFGNREQVRGEGGGESESGCICAPRVVHYTESRKNEVEGFPSGAGGTRVAGVASEVASESFATACNEAQGPR